MGKDSGWLAGSRSGPQYFYLADSISNYQALALVVPVPGHSSPRLDHPDVGVGSAGLEHVPVAETSAETRSGAQPANADSQSVCSGRPAAPHRGRAVEDAATTVGGL